MKLELFHPVSPVILNQGWGENKDFYKQAVGTNGHNGLDYYAVDGQPVHAAHNGLVTFTGQDGSGGETCVIRTEEKREYLDGESHFKTIYCHLKTGTFKVKPGQRVKVGDVIALADNTGMSTGSHLHFGLKPIYRGEADWQWYNDKPDNGFKGAIDPTPYLSKLTAAQYKSIWNQLLTLSATLYKMMNGR